MINTPKSTLFLFGSIWITLALESNKHEYCVNEVFSPSCSTNEIIIMNQALYGQMSIGKCIDIDVGYVGCQANVLPQFDHECSGQSSCQIAVIDIEASGGCPSAISKYLLAGYTCVQSGLTKPPSCDDDTTGIALQNRQSFISSAKIKSVCSSAAANWILTAQSGQTLNVSAFLLSQNPGTYGSIEDMMTNEKIMITHGPRYKHLLTSTSSQFKVVLPRNHDENNFILNITIIGCPNLSPPNGAWMTRDGDKMEIGCHSGEKSWTMECKDNQWVGAIGQCGYQTVNLDGIVESFDEKNKVRDVLSMNSIIFAACSVLILVSSIIFIIGVLLLKRQQAKDQRHFGKGATMEYMTTSRFPTIR